MLPAHIFCSSCGVKNQKDAAFCFNCGGQLARPDAAANTLQTPANAAGSGQPETTPTITSPSDSTSSEINSATGFLSTHTILKQRYRILHSVGRGGMGAVYMGEDIQLGHRLVAIKEMSQGSLYYYEVRASPLGSDTSVYIGRSIDGSYIGMLFGFALIALTGIFLILATTTKSFGLSHTKSKEEMTQKITTILATFVLLSGTTLLLPETIGASVLCFLVGGGVLIATQWRQ